MQRGCQASAREAGVHHGRGTLVADPSSAQISPSKWRTPTACHPPATGMRRASGSCPPAPPPPAASPSTRPRSLTRARRPRRRGGGEAPGWAGGAGGPGLPLVTRRARQVHADGGGLPPPQERPPDPPAPPAARPQDRHHPRVRVQREQPGHDPPPAPAQARPRHLPGEPQHPGGRGGPGGPAAPQGGIAGLGLGVLGRCWTGGAGARGPPPGPPPSCEAPERALLAAPRGGPAPAGAAQPRRVPQLCPARGHLQLHRGHQLHRGQPGHLLRLRGGPLGECRGGGTGPAEEGALQPRQPAQPRGSCPVLPRDAGIQLETASAPPPRVHIPCPGGHLCICCS